MALGIIIGMTVATAVWFALMVWSGRRGNKYNEEVKRLLEEKNERLRVIADEIRDLGMNFWRKL